MTDYQLVYTALLVGMAVDTARGRWWLDGSRLCGVVKLSHGIEVHYDDSDLDWGPGIVVLSDPERFQLQVQLISRGVTLGEVRS